MAGGGNGKGSMTPLAAALAAGMAAQRAGNLAEAERQFRRAHGLDPSHVGARGNLAQALVALGRAEEALPHWRAVAEARPAMAAAQRGLGDACLAAGRPADAIAPYERALALERDAVPVLINMGQALVAAGRARDAIAPIERALALQPSMAEAHYAAGDAAKVLGEVERAAASYARALELRPDFLEARFNLAVLAQEQGALDDAERHYRAILSAVPEHPRAHNNLGAVLADQHKHDDAAAAYARAAALDPRYAEPHENLGNTFQEQGRVAEARESFSRALAVAPSDGVRVKLATLLPVIPRSDTDVRAARADYERGLAALEREPPVLADPLKQVGKTSFYLAYAGENDRDLQRRLAAIHARACPLLTEEAPHVREKRTDGRIRVGFVSRFLRSHTIGRLMEGVILGLDRERFEVSLIGPAQPDDAMSARLAAGVDRAVALPPDLSAARARIAELRLDVLHFPDIGMEPFSYFLGFARLARLQCAFWGHPDTTGLPNMDLFLSSADLDGAEAQEHYTERLIRLPTLNTSYARPPAPDPLPDRAALGLPDDATLYVSAQTLFKYHPDSDALYRRILEGDPKGVLVMVKGNHAHWTDLLKARFARNLGRAAERVLFLDRLDRARFLALLARADVVLDTPVFCGGNSTLETLAMGSPVVTLPSGYLRGRISAACYAKMGYDDLVARDEDAYARIALALGADREARMHARARIAETSNALFGDPRPVRELEDLIERELAAIS